MKNNYEDYSSGRVIYGAPGATNFPVSLSIEIFEKCREYLYKNGNSGPYKIYDPFCGVAYSLTVLGLLFGENIKEIYASDADTTILEFAHKNLSLLSEKGIDKRINELEKFIKDYNKDSHKDALESAKRLQILSKKLSIKIKEFQFNILKDSNLPQYINNIDIIMADVPYGKLTNWDSLEDGINPIQESLNKIKDRLNTKSIVAIILNKKQTIEYNGYDKIKSFKLGKRKIILLSPVRIRA